MSCLNFQKVELVSKAGREQLPNFQYPNEFKDLDVTSNTGSAKIDRLNWTVPQLNDWWHIEQHLKARSGWNLVLNHSCLLQCTLSKQLICSESSISRKLFWFYAWTFVILMTPQGWGTPIKKTHHHHALFQFSNPLHPAGASVSLHSFHTHSTSIPCGPYHPFSSLKINSKTVESIWESNSEL